MTETINLAGSGLVFVNTLGSNVTAAYHSAIIAAENFFQSHFTNAVTLNMSFDLQALPLAFSGQNFFNPVANFSYAALSTALRQHATTADDIAAVASLPIADPSAGHGFELSIGMARILGLAGAGTSIDDRIVLSSNLSWTFGADAIGVLEHEISEGAMGRIGSLGVWSTYWTPMDLFRYSSPGQRDYTGGRDGLATYFSVDGTHLLTQFHNAVDTHGVYDKYDFADWDKTVGDAFGPGGPGSPGVMTTVDLRIMDILGWTPTSATPPAITDDFANSLTDTTHPFGQVAVNSSATGTLEINGDRDWFRVQLIAGTTYVVNLLGTTLVDPYLRLRNAAGTVLDENDDIDNPVNRNSQITYTVATSGTYYLEAGAFDDVYSGSYQISLNSVADDYASSLTDTSHPFGVLLNGAASGTLEVTGDRDWFRVQLTAGTRYLINLVGNTLEDPYLRVHDASGATPAENDDIVSGINLNSQLTFTAATTGTYYLEAGAFDDSYTGTYTVTVSLTSDDYANGLADISHPFGQAVVNGTIAGNLEVAGDRDWFRIQFTTGISYTVKLSGNSLQDAYLRLRDNTGVLLAENDDISLGSDRNSLLTFTAKSTGNYYLEAGSFLDAYSGTYSLTVTAPTPGIVTNLALSVAIGGAATILSSLLTASDIDDTAAQLTYSISTAPSFGTLLKSGLAVTQFTQQDINSGLISYRENGTVTLSDSFIFQVVDPAGFRSPSTQFRIQIPSSTQPGTIIGAGVSAGTNGKHDVFLRTASNQLLYQQYDNGGPLAGQLGFIFQGKAWVVDAATTAIGSSQSFWGYGGHDVFLRNGAGQLVADEFAADGSALDGIALTFRGAPWIIAAGTTAVGAGQGFWGYGGHDVYLRTSAGQLVADEFDNAGAAISGIALTFLGNPWTITATTTAIGSGQGFWGYGGHDVYLRTGTGQLVADEFDSNGAAISGIALTFLGSPWIVDATTTAIGSGQDFWGYGGHDVYLRSGTGQLVADEFDSAGRALAGIALTFLGSPWIVDAATTAIGSGQGFWGYGGHDVFLRNGAGQLIADEFDSAGRAIDGIALTYLGNPLIVTPNTTAIGSGQSFWGYGGHDVFLRTGSGQLVAAEFADNGAIIDGTPLTFLGNPWIVDTATTAIGTGQNFWGYHGHDVFLRNGLGQVFAEEFDRTGAAIDARMLTFLGNPWVVDNATTVIGSGQGFWGFGGNDVFLHLGNGQLAADEFGSNGAVIAGISLTYLGTAWIVAPTVTAIGAGQSFWGYGGHDVFLRTGAGQLVAAEFADNGAIMDGTALTFIGNPWIVDTATIAIGTAQNFWGYHGHDVFLRNGLGQVLADEFGADGAAISCIGLTYNGAAWTVDTATHAIGAGHNFAGSGGNDVFLLNGLGQLGFGEFNAGGVATAPAMIFITGTGFVGPTTTIAATGQNLLAGGEKDLLLRELGGQLHIWAVSNANALIADLALKFGNGATATVGITDTIAGAGQNQLGLGGHDITITNAAGQATTWEFNNAGTVLGIR